MMGEIVARNI